MSVAAMATALHQLTAVVKGLQQEGAPLAGDEVEAVVAKTSQPASRDRVNVARRDPRDDGRAPRSDRSSSARSVASLEGDGGGRRDEQRRQSSTRRRAWQSTAKTT
ncbi:hypothetical protein PC111_g21174 [Phytophthora cactorum]|uniref:Uncharacterized protein n=1 Tax=Phytophthora cactorum TaxID=29920 RepID=A0A8T1AJY6_9STRA|nr:hypothetical protein PC111_g21174 [Phytophthora cactorum]KAG2884466.1 hypothetical protein PC115_g21328 [Phytophthora cactorum]